MTENHDILDGMAGPFLNPSGDKGRFVVKADGTVVPEAVASLPDPASIPPLVTAAPPIIGPSRIGEFLMVDIRTAKMVPKGSKLFKICQRLSRVRGCGVIESTLVIDLLIATDDEGRFLLCPTNWPKPESEVSRGKEE